MLFITTVLKNGESYSGPPIEASTWADAEKAIADIENCQVTGLLDSSIDQLPL